MLSQVWCQRSKMQYKESRYKANCIEKSRNYKRIYKNVWNKSISTWLSFLNDSFFLRSFQMQAFLNPFPASSFQFSFSVGQLEHNLPDNLLSFYCTDTCPSFLFTQSPFHYMSMLLMSHFIMTVCPFGQQLYLNLVVGDHLLRLNWFQTHSNRRMGDAWVKLY